MANIAQGEIVNSCIKVEIEDLIPHNDRAMSSHQEISQREDLKSIAPVVKSDEGCSYVLHREQFSKTTSENQPEAESITCCCLDDISEFIKTKLKKYTCSACASGFATVCLLHEHLKFHGSGGSYHYDHVSNTAYPKYDTFCSSTQTEDLNLSAARTEALELECDTINEKSVELETAVDTVEEEKQSDVPPSATRVTRKRKQAHPKQSKSPHIKSKQNTKVQSSELTSACFNDSDHVTDTNNKNTYCCHDENPKTTSQRKTLEGQNGSFPISTLDPSNVIDITAIFASEPKKKSIRLFDTDHMYTKPDFKKVKKMRNHSLAKTKRVFKESQSEAERKISVYTNGKNSLNTKMIKEENKTVKHVENSLKQQTRLDSELGGTKDGPKEPETVTVAEKEDNWNVHVPKIQNTDLIKGKKESTKTRKRKVVPKDTGKEKEEILEKKNTGLNGEKSKRARSKKQKDLNENDGNILQMCEICKITVLKKRFKRHMASHNPEQRCICEICGKSFGNRRRLTKHQISHREVKPWPCSLCPAQFCAKKEFKIHMARHEGIRPHVCNVCDMRFITKKSLHQHQENIHMGITKFQCDYCDRRFFKKSGLMTHRATHFEASLECSYCERKFKDKTSLKRHERIHTGIKMYQCHICDHAFNQCTPYFVHMEKHHGMKRPIVKEMLKHVHEANKRSGNKSATIMLPRSVDTLVRQLVSSEKDGVDNLQQVTDTKIVQDDTGTSKSAETAIAIISEPSDSGVYNNHTVLSTVNDISNTCVSTLDYGQQRLSEALNSSAQSQTGASLIYSKPLVSGLASNNQLNSANSFSCDGELPKIIPTIQGALENCLKTEVDVKVTDNGEHINCKLNDMVTYSYNSLVASSCAGDSPSMVYSTMGYIDVLASPNPETLTTLQSLQAVPNEISVPFSYIRQVDYPHGQSETFYEHSNKHTV